MIHQQKKPRMVLWLFNLVICEGPSLKVFLGKFLREEIQLLIVCSKTHPSTTEVLPELMEGVIPSLKTWPWEEASAGLESSQGNSLGFSGDPRSCGKFPWSHPYGQDLPASGTNLLAGSPNLFRNSNLSVHLRHSQPMSAIPILKERQLYYQKSSPLRREGISKANMPRWA